MIDYEKIKLAHELCEKTDGYYFYCTYSSKFGIDDIDLCHNDKYDEDCKDIDDLITKLQELTRLKPKYKLGQEVFFIILAQNWVIIDSKIEHYEHKTGEYYLAGHWYKENHLYSTKEALIQAQIDYWHLLKCPKFEGEIKGFNSQESCQHEFHRGICKKCGEFYK